MKSTRHAMILEIINGRSIETQEELASELQRRGVHVTQATVSRDIKELRLLKVPSVDGGYKYATAQSAEQGSADRFIRIFSESVVSIASANNLVVIHTLSGSANGAAEAVDNLAFPEVLGTLAGDNTILVIVQSNDAVRTVVDRFRGMIRKHP